MQTSRIDEVPDFFPEPIRNPIKADFQSLDNVLLTGKDLDRLLALNQFVMRAAHRQAQEILERESIVRLNRE